MKPTTEDFLLYSDVLWHKIISENITAGAALEIELRAFMSVYDG